MQMADDVVPFPITKINQVAMVVRSLGVHLRKAAAPPKPVIFDRTPKKGA
jgi:hypothetical protein